MSSVNHSLRTVILDYFTIFKFKVHISTILIRIKLIYIEVFFLLLIALISMNLFSRKKNGNN